MEALKLEDWKLDMHFEDFGLEYKKRSSMFFGKDAKNGC